MEEEAVFRGVKQFFHKSSQLSTASFDLIYKSIKTISFYDEPTRKGF
jgi:hypothetical protein